MSTLYVDKVDPSTGTALELGSSGDTVNLGSGVTAGTGFYNDDQVQSNIAMLGFKVAVNGSLVKYDLVDQAIDEYQDASGIDASASTNEVRNASDYYSGTTSSAGEAISATGGGGGDVNGGGSGGTGTGGSAQGTGGDGGDPDVSSPSAGGNGTGGGPGGGGGGGGDVGGAVGGDGDASYYTGGGGGGGGDGGGAGVGGTGYKDGGDGGLRASAGTDGEGEGGNGSTYGAGDAGAEGSVRKNNGGGGAYAGAGGGAGSDGFNAGGSGGGGGGSGAVVFKYTNAGAQVVHRFSGTSYAVPSGSTNLIVYCIGGGGGGGCGQSVSNDSGGGGAGGGLAVSNTFSDGERTVTYTIGAAGAGSTTTGGNGGTTSVTIGAYTAYNDMTLQSNDTTAEAEPDNADMVTLIENAAGTATLNTDIKGYISRDSGTTFTQGTLVDEGTWGTNKKILAFHDLDISSQPSGTSMCYKIETLNQSASIDTRIYATSMGWR